MPLFVVATPIGNALDFSTRAVETLRAADLIIGEELKVLRQTLKSAGVQGKALEQLNEHSDERDIAHFVNECRNQTVALVSDCGTPGFCDPGADLVAACAKENILVKPVPGASSLMALLSVCGVRLDRFVFYGFLPAKNELREKEINALKKETRPFILMETPYRSQKFIEELAKSFPKHHCVLALDLTLETETILRGPPSTFAGKSLENREPIALLVPKAP